MSIDDEKVREIGRNLKDRALKENIKVDDAFVVELGNYAGHMVVNELDDDSMSLVLKSIGEATIKAAKKTEGALTGPLVVETIQEICFPTAWETCSGAAFSILKKMGRFDDAAALETAKTRVLADFALNDLTHS